MAPDLYEIDVSFGSHDEYTAWRAHNPHVFDAIYGALISSSVTSQGCKEPLTSRQIPGGEIEPSENYREGLISRGINSRMRAVLRAIELEAAKNPAHFVYAAESITAMAKVLRNAFPCFIGSEYIDEALRDGTHRHEDLTNLSFPDDAFDIVTTNEVLEHVPDIDACLREMARVLKPGRWHIGTCPFTNTEDSLVRTMMEGDEKIYLMEPEYHGDPIKGGQNSLVFEIPGWNILERARKAGFSRAEIRLIASAEYGCVANNEGAITLLCFQK